MGVRLSNPTGFVTAVRMYLGDGSKWFSDATIGAVGDSFSNPSDAAQYLRKLWREENLD